MSDGGYALLIVGMALLSIWRKKNIIDKIFNIIIINFLLMLFLVLDTKSREIATILPVSFMFLAGACLSVTKRMFNLGTLTYADNTNGNKLCCLLPYYHPVLIGLLIC